MKTRSPWWTAAALAVFTVLPAMPVIAAEPPAAPAAMPVPTPAPEIGQLAFFAGDWSCKGQVETTPFGPQHPTEAKVHIRKEFRGFWYVGRYEERKSAGNPLPMSFEFVMGYDGAGKTWTLDGFDAFGSRSHQTSPGWQEGKLVFSGESTGNGAATPARDTFTKKSETNLEHQGEMQFDGKWVQIDRETCTRTQK
jgi:hypothetical protein